jgi:hypothetical protein
MLPLQQVVSGRGRAGVRGDARRLAGGRVRGVQGQTVSEAELLLAVQLEQAGIPFEREYRFAPPRKWRADFAVVLFRHPSEPSYAAPDQVDLLIEVDGGAFIAGRHSRGTGVEKDAEKQSAAAILGYRVIRCTPRQVENGLALSWIKQALGLEDRNAA